MTVHEAHSTAFPQGLTLLLLVLATATSQLAVCVIELWPEARACKNDRALAVGILLGSLVMGWTLWIGG